MSIQPSSVGAFDAARHADAFLAEMAETLLPPPPPLPPPPKRARRAYMTPDRAVRPAAERPTVSMARQLAPGESSALPQDAAAQRRSKSPSANGYLRMARKGGPDRVVQYRRAIEKSTDDDLTAFAYIGLGHALADPAHFETALERTRNPNIQARAHLGLGNARRSESDFRRALELTTENGTRSNAHLGLGHAARAKRQRLLNEAEIAEREAIRHYTTAADCAPTAGTAARAEQALSTVPRIRVSPANAEPPRGTVHGSVAFR